MTFLCQFTKQACRRECEPQEPCWFARRSAQLLSQLSDPNAVTMAVAAMNKMLAAEGLNFSDIGNMIKGQRYSADDMEHAFKLGKEKGLREAAQHNTALEFFDGYGEPRWYDMAVFCRDNVAGNHRISAWEKEFSNDIAGKTLGREPSHKQKQCILRIFVKLGGQCDPNVQARYFQR